MPLNDYIREIPDYPKQGIVFYDITPLLADAKAFHETIDRLYSQTKDLNPTKIVAAEARGFLLAAPLALQFNVGIVPIRKPGKLPGKTLSASYDLEYGSNTLHIHADAFTPDDRVLIVDDMVVNRLILSELLESNGVASDLAESGKECIDLCRENTYDLILLDHRMPELDGIDTLLQLKRIFEAQGRVIPVVCHTTEDARNNTNLYKAAGFADVLFKPIQPKLLSEILMRYLPEGSQLKFS